MIKGMKEVLEESQHLGGWNEKHLQLVYNKRTNTLWYEVFIGSVGNSFLQLNNEDDINLGFISTRLSEEEVEQAIINALNGEYYIWGPPSKALIDKIVKAFRETCDPEFEFEGTTEELYPAIHSWIEQQKDK